MFHVSILKKYIQNILYKIDYKYLDILEYMSYPLLQRKKFLLMILNDIGEVLGVKLLSELILANQLQRSRPQDCTMVKLPQVLPKLPLTI